MKVIEQRVEQDPVCGMRVEVKPATDRSSHAGKDYYFCCRSCLDKFAANPQKYVQPQPAPAPVEQSEAGVEYTCPMHPEIARLGPGACPICGMALEPRTVTSAEENPELREMARRFWACVMLTAPVLVVMISEVLPGRPIQSWLGGTALVWIQFALALRLYCGAAGRSLFAAGGQQ